MYHYILYLIFRCCCCCWISFFLASVPSIKKIQSLNHSSKLHLKHLIFFSIKDCNRFIDDEAIGTNRSRLGSEIKHFHRQKPPPSSLFQDGRLIEKLIEKNSMNETQTLTQTYQMEWMKEWREKNFQSSSQAINSILYSFLLSSFFFISNSLYIFSIETLRFNLVRFRERKRERM